MWSQSSREEISVPLGWESGGSPVLFRIGGVQTQHHALLAGKTGSGKSNMLHVIIHSLCARYAPEQLQLFLLDYKQGVEMNVYARNCFPNAALVSTESDIEYGITVLEHFVRERERRAAIFKQLGKQNLTDLSDIEARQFPRWLLIIDEFQILFSGDASAAKRAEDLLVLILRQGRSYGLHVLLSTQTLSGIPAQSMSQLNAQIGIRLCLSCNQQDSFVILGQTNDAGTRLKSPPEAILNEAAGDKTRNIVFKVPHAEREVCEAHFKEIAGISRWKKVRPKTKIFDGAALPLLPPVSSLGELSSAKENRLFLGEELNYEAPPLSCKMGKRDCNLFCVGADEKIRNGLIASAIRSVETWAGAAEILYYSSYDDEERFVFNPNGASVSFVALNDDNLLEHLEKQNPAKAQLLILDGMDFAKSLHTKGGYGAKATPVEEALLARLRDGAASKQWTLALGVNWPRNKQAFHKEIITAFNLRVAFVMGEAEAADFLGIQRFKGTDNPVRAFFNDLFKPNSGKWFRPFDAREE